MERTFTYALVGDLSAKLAQIKAAAAARGVYFSGNPYSGHFSGMGISGFHSISGLMTTVMVDSKHFFVSWAYIDAQSRGFVES